MTAPPAIEVSSSKLEEVWLYKDRVVAVHRATVELPAGVSEVQLRDVPIAGDLSATRARASSAMILSVAVRSRAFPSSEAADQAPDSEPSTRGQIAGARAVIELLDRLEPGPAGPSLHPDGLWAATHFVLQERSRWVEVLTRARAQLEAPEADASSSPGQTGSFVDLQVRMAEPGPCDLEIQTEAGWGTWRPAYILSVEEGLCRLLPYADVWHRTALRGSCGRLFLRENAPAPRIQPLATTPWMVRSDRAYEERSRELYADQPARPSGSGPTASSHVVNSSREGAELTGRGPNRAFPSGASFDVVTQANLDQEFFRVPVQAPEVSVPVKYLCRPVADPRAFAYVDLEPADPGQFHGGRLSIVVEGTRCGHVDVGDAKASRSWRIEIGPETGILCRRFVRTGVRVEGLLQKDDVHHVEICCELMSRASKEVLVQVEDQVPLSTDPRVRIRVVEMSPEGSLNPTTGIASFNVKIAPAGRRVIRLHYEIEAPHDYRLVQTLGSPS